MKDNLKENIKENTSNTGAKAPEERTAASNKKPSAPDKKAPKSKNNKATQEKKASSSKKKKKEKTALKESEQNKNNGIDIINLDEKKKKHLSAVFFIFAIAFGILIVTLGTRYGINFVTSLYTSSGTTQVFDWRFIWGNSDKEISGDVTVWKQANSGKRVKKLKMGQNYLRLNLTIPPSEKSQKLIINTNYCPIKVALDSDEIYINGYGSSQFVGNMSNRITIPSSAMSRNLDVYIYSPSQVSLSSYLSPASAGEGRYLNYLGIVAACGIILAGFMMMLTTLLISFRNTYLNRMILLGITVIFCGAGLLVYNVSFYTDLMKEPVFYNLQVMLDLVTSFLVIICSYISCRTNEKFKFIGFVPFVIVSTAAVMFITSAMVIKIMLFGYIAIMLAAIIITLASFVERVENKIKYSWVSAVVFACISLMSLYNTFSFAVGFGRFSRFIDSTIIIVFSMILFGVFFKQSINKVVRIQEREEQTRKNTQWSKQLAEMFAELFVQKDNEGFIRKAANVINDIVVKDLSEKKDSSVEISKKLSEGLAICACLIEGDTIHNISLDGQSNNINCDFGSVIELYNKTGKKAQFANTSFNMVLTTDSKPCAAFHVENIVNGLSMHFKTLINTALSNIELIYNNFKLKSEINLTQENIFIALAETVESISHGSRAHLISVRETTRILARQLGFSPREAGIVAAASVAHDIGKIAIPEKILKKNGKLTQQEMEMMKRHVIYGYNILSQSRGEFMDAAAVIAYHHHERYDGTGYLGFKGEQIHIYARIVAVADVFDALLSKRAYKEAWSTDDVKKYLNERSGTEFDPAVIEAFNACFDEILEIKGKHDVEEAAVNEA